jgi:hypothetical protein
VWLKRLILAAVIGAWAEPTLASPIVVDPGFQIELYADLGTLPDPNDTLPDNPKAFGLLLTSGENGFPKGLYVTGDFATSPPLLRVDGPNQVSLVKEGFVSNDTLLFPRGAYRVGPTPADDGMFITVSTELAIKRLLSDGTITTFATLGSPLFGPANMTYFPDDSLLVAGGSDGILYHVDPNGTSTPFASIPINSTAAISLVKGILPLSSSLATQFGGPLLASSFHKPLPGPYNFPFAVDSIFVVSADGQTVTPIATDVETPNFLREGPGGAFGSDVYVPQTGSNVNGSGRVSILRPDGSLTPFVTGINAADVVFDTEGILGGGMFISDLNSDFPNPEDMPGLIWRVPFVPEPSSLILAGLWTFCLIGYRWLRRYPKRKDYDRYPLETA